MTSPVAVHGVRVLGEGVPYLDGAEDELFDIISEAPDRSTDSDDLASRIRDWPTRYHLSRLRSNLLMPLQITPGMRVLDVGCGTGVLSRYFAEQGAQVTGLEGSLARARVAAARTSGMTNCEIVCGSLEEYIQEGHAEEFSLVLLCGVLEYSGSDIGGSGGPEAMLRQAQSLLRADGVVVLAIENQIGLKYLLWYPEDHRGVPWVGVEGYQSGRNPAQTWPRRQLTAMLRDSGLTEQRWLLPYPDYKLPSVVARADLFDTAEGRDLLRLFLRNPVQDYSAPSMLTADPVAAFRTMLDAGLGVETANSFLVVAGREGTDPDAVVRDGDLWMSSGERAAELMDRRVLRRHDDGWALHPLNNRAEVHLPPLSSVRSEVPVVIGSNLEDEIVAVAARASSPDELKPLMTEWWEAVKPWLATAPGSGYHFDVLPRNFIRTEHGALHYVDREWIWTEQVPESWALLRAMWFLVLQRLWPAGATAGLSWSLTLGEASLALARLVEHALPAQALDDAVEVEGALQGRVQKKDADVERRQLRELLSRPLTLLSIRPSFAQILERPLIAEAQATQRWQAAELKELQVMDETAGMRAEVVGLRQRVGELEAKVAWLQGMRPSAQMKRARRLGGKIKRRLA